MGRVEVNNKRNGKANVNIFQWVQKFEKKNI